MSSSIAPGVVTLAFWVAQQVLDGHPPPKDLQVPYLKISQDTLADTLAKTPSGGLANKLYTQQDAEQLRAVGH